MEITPDILTLLTEVASLPLVLTTLVVHLEFPNGDNNQIMRGPLEVDHERPEIKNLVTKSLLGCRCEGGGGGGIGNRNRKIMYFMYNTVYLKWRKTEGKS
jgi:hypothetical protein